MKIRIRQPLRDFRDSLLYKNETKIKSLPPNPYFSGNAHFLKTSNTLFKMLKSAGLKPEHSVLDVGCGNGRVAFSLVEYLKGDYVGMDIAKEQVQWCQNNITPVYPKFRFIHINVFNSFYNPTGDTKDSNFLFPFPTESFDFVFLTSVFTHMEPEGLKNYLLNIKRVLKTDGTCVMTFFISGVTGLKENKPAFDFKPIDSSYSVVDKEVPEAAVCYNEKFLMREIAFAGLKLTNIKFGNWRVSGNIHNFQDVIIVTK